MAGAVRTGTVREMAQNQPPGLLEETPGPVSQPDGNPNPFRIMGLSAVISLDYRLILQDV